MPSFISDHPMFCALALVLIDIAVWRLISADFANWKLAARLVIFAVFSAVLFNEGMNPMQVAPFGDNVALHLAATAFQIGWWLFAARTLTVLLGAVMMQRVGHTGRLLQDLVGAVIFLIAIIAAMAYVLDLPVKGVLATSGAVAIIVGLALQSTLSDVFSGIVLNTTKPYQLDDWISIDGTEGRVIDIDWRATQLQTSQGSLAVVPNSLAAKAKIINFSRPADMFGVADTPASPAPAHPARFGAAHGGWSGRCRGVGRCWPSRRPAWRSRRRPVVAWSMRSAGLCRPWRSSVRCAISFMIWRFGICRRRG